MLPFRFDILDIVSRVLVVVRLIRVHLRKQLIGRFVSSKMILGVASVSTNDIAPEFVASL
jgi:hypothetical protein